MTKKMIQISAAFAAAAAADLNKNRSNFELQSETIRKEAQEKLDALGKAATATNDEIWKRIWDEAGVPEEDRAGWKLDVDYVEIGFAAIVTNEDTSASSVCGCGDPDCGSGPSLGDILGRALAMRGAG